MVGPLCVKTVIFGLEQYLFMPTTDSSNKVHHGHNIKRFREMFGMKQEALAIELGEEWSQKKVSRLEENEIIDDEILKQVSDILKVPVDAIKSFSEDVAHNFFNSFNDHSVNHVVGNYGTYNVNPIDKLIELVDENKKLYEQLLASEREKNQLLQRMLDKQ